MTDTGIKRRTFMGATALGVGSTALGVEAASAAAPAAAPAAPASRTGVGYGPLRPDPDGLLDLPAGFSYTVLAVSGNSGNPVPATTLDDGPEESPSRYDGTGSFPVPGGGWVLVSNHENGDGVSFPVATAVPHRDGITYDEGDAYGGTTSIRVSSDGQRVGEVVSLAGTYSNCAGGLSLWDTWLTCEETEAKAGTYTTARGPYTLMRDHGYVFEVRAHDATNPANAQPIKAFGRFPHEAAVVDPDRGEVLLTEDAGSPNGLLYKWTPDGPAPQGGYDGLADDAGTLWAMLATDGGAPVPDLSVYSALGTTLDVTWKEVTDRDARTTSTRKQFDHLAKDASGAFTVPVAGVGGAITRSRKLEGAWWGDGGAYVAASFARYSDGSLAQHDGQVWHYDPASETITLTVFYAYTPDDQDTDPDGPDNITVNPYGGLVVCEDGDGQNHLVLDDLAGGWAFLALNRQDSEMAGANFSDTGRFLFANSQDPGVVFAIRGPWKAKRVR